MGEASAARQGQTLAPDRTGVGFACGTFGELLQGVLPEPDSDFLVTMPIARWTSAMFRLAPDRTGIRVFPVGKHKSRRVAETMLRRYRVPVGGTLTLESTIPEGKGLASSSADLVATVRAVADAIGAEVSPPEIEALLRLIEPTDGVMYPDVVAFHHRTVRLRARLGHLPPLTIVGVDEGGQVDTIAFNRIPKSFTAAEKREYGRLLEAVTVAISTSDLAAVGAIATRSAILNQRLRPKETLSDLIAIAGQIGALGVICAHSGTALGLLLSDEDANYPDRLVAARRACVALARGTWVDRSLPPRAGGEHHPVSRFGWNRL